ncbi:MAG: hypothetical protein ACLSGN_06830 [Oscillospiraceae bacterium]
MIKPEFAVTADGRQLDANTITDSYLKAVNINRNIIVNAQAAQMSLYEVCKGLKTMRDDKLYKELGYQNFKIYCENEIKISYDMARKYIVIFENIDPGQPFEKIGVSKLYLLSTLSEEERTEITESTDLESVSKRELEEKIKEIRSLNTKLDTAENEKESLKEELGQISRERENLYRQVKELEARPIDITVRESDSHEIANMKEAMKICDNQWAEKYNELQESTIVQNRRIHQEYKEKIDSLTAEYEQKLAEMPAQSEKQVSVPDMKETFKFYYSMTYNAFSTLILFVKKQEKNDRQFCFERLDKLMDLFKKDMQEV